MGLYRDEYPHQLTRDEAVARLRALTDYWDAQYGTHTSWEGHQGRISGRVLGLSFWSNFVIDEHTIHGELKVSALAVRMGGRAYLKRKFDHYMNPSVSLTELQALVPGAEPRAARA
jgi:hypothetical protein